MLTVTFLSSVYWLLRLKKIKVLYFSDIFSFESSGPCLRLLLLPSLLLSLETLPQLLDSLPVVLHLPEVYLGCFINAHGAPLTSRWRFHTWSGNCEVLPKASSLFGSRQ